MNKTENTELADELNARFLSIELRFDKIEAELDRRINSCNESAIERDNHVMENLSQLGQAVTELNTKVDNRSQGHGGTMDRKRAV